MRKRMGIVGALAGIVFGITAAAAPMQAQAATWQQQGNKLYAYDDAGNLITNALVPFQGYTYAAGADGSLQTGWVPLNGANYLFDEQGRLLADGATVDGYVVNELGQCVATIGVDPSQIAYAEDWGSVIDFYIGPKETWWDDEMVELDAATEQLNGATGRPLVVAAAQSLVGKPYVWGGQDADGVDCSGLVVYAYWAALQDPLLHDADLQSKLGREVAFSNLQPGDICCYDWDGDGTVEHVGIYIGGGKICQASSSSNVVKISSVKLNGKNPVTCRSLFAD
ncbi:MAG: NlpC/P60 family protein [Firmicutes bacterium]|nr:NlpC/P60 family protein [Bacillota bacterium]